jgi:hypothetical protein
MINIKCHDCGTDCEVESKAVKLLCVRCLKYHIDHYTHVEEVCDCCGHSL